MTRPSSAEFTRKTKSKAFWRCAGHCEAEGCGAKLQPGRFTYDHILPVELGGEPTLENCQVICRACDVVKTRGDIQAIRKSDRQRDRHINAIVPKQAIRSAPFAKRDRSQRQRDMAELAALAPAAVAARRAHL